MGSNFSELNTKLLKFLREKGIYVLLMLTASGASLIREFFFAKLLGSHGYGYFSVTMLASAYILPFIGLGLKEGFMREGSILIVDKNSGCFRELRVVTLSASFIISLILVIAFLATYLVTEFALYRNFFLPYCYALLVASSTNFFNIILNDLRVVANLRMFSFGLAARSIMVLVIGAIGISTSGYEGAIVSDFMVTSVLSLLLFALLIPNYKILFKTNEVRKLSGFGVQVAFTSLLNRMSFSIDRWFIAFSLGITALGTYSFSLLTFTVAITLTNIADQALAPKWCRQFGLSNDPLKVHQNCLRASTLFFVFYALFFWLLWNLFVHFLVYRFPEFDSAIVYIPFILIGGVFHSTNYFDWVPIAVGKPHIPIVVSCLSCLLMLFSCIMIVYLGLGLQWFAISFAFNRLARLIMSYYSSYRIAYSSLG